MQKLKFNFEYLKYESFEQLPEEDRSLIEAAIEATKGSYSPFSNYCVGAAILLDNGVVVKGANQENAAFPSGLCAERTAAFYANATYPNAKMKAIAIVATKNNEMVNAMFYPCGACRQVLLEYEMKGEEPLKVIVANRHKVHVFESIKHLIPFHFEFN